VGRDPLPQAVNKRIRRFYRHWDGLVYVSETPFPGQEAPGAVQRAILVVRAQDFISWAELQGARHDVQGLAYIGREYKVTRVCSR